MGIAQFDRRARLMLATLGFLRLQGAPPPVIQALHHWLDCWSGVGMLERGMYWQGYDLRLERYADRGWRATFFLAGMVHSFTWPTGTAWELVAWRAVQVAARVAVWIVEGSDGAGRWSLTVGMLVGDTLVR